MYQEIGCIALSNHKTVHNANSYHATFLLFMVKFYFAIAELGCIFLLLGNSHLSKKETKFSQYP